MVPRDSKKYPPFLKLDQPTPPSPPGRKTAGCPSLGPREDGACADAFFLAAVRVTEDGCRMVKVEIRVAKTERCCVFICLLW
ncbi:hypothetical protein [Eisenbergiella porci]|uniref:hypothetical protein n=2 Tax=Eisenbergiella porci TaxID=2652274 RepID=UPI000C8506E7|nr:hypothetical protein [Eisenbergiella porci]MBS7033129.1 hypothetical protein [Clostridium sp.]